jgi:serine/threonine protein kinase
VDGRVALPKGILLDSSYRIERVIGSGGFGVTYQAEDVNLATKVAIKEYYPADFGRRDDSLSVRPTSAKQKPIFEWGRSSFLDEARTLARFRHQSVVHVSRVFEAYSTAYMVMIFEQGSSLETWLEALGRTPTQEELDRIVAPLLDALEMMHAQNFLHRDIAPDNIIIRADGTPVLLDFGAARRAVAEMSRALTGIVKAGYSPQEQYATDPRLQGAWSDFYALGATLYRAVSGRPPDEATLRGIDDRMQPAAKVAIGEYRSGFLTAIDACLRVRGADRPQSVGELRPLLLDTPGRAGREAGDRPARPWLDPAGAVAWVGATRRRWPAAAAAAAVLILGGVTVLAWQRPPRVDPAIGTATMEKDGTIVVDVRNPGTAILRYAPSDAHYDEVSKHIGPMRPGESRLVKPWPESGAPAGK